MIIQRKLSLALLATLVFPLSFTFSNDNPQPLPIYLDKGQVSNYNPNEGLPFRGLHQSVFYRLVIEPESGEKQKKLESKIFLGSAFPDTLTKITIYRDVYYASGEHIRESTRKGANPGLKATQEISKAAKEDPIAAIGYVFTIPLIAVGAVTGGAKGILTSRKLPQQSKPIASLVLNDESNTLNFKDTFKKLHFSIKLEIKKIDNSHYSVEFSAKKID